MSINSEIELVAFGSFTNDLIENPEGVKGYFIGGSVCYFSFAAKALGLNVLPVGYISNEIQGKELSLIKEMFDTSYLTSSDGLSFHIKYDKEWNAEYIKDLAEETERFNYRNVPIAPYVHVCVISNIDHQLEIMKYFKSRGCRVSGGTYLLRVEKDREKVMAIIDTCDLFFLNKVEAAALSRGKDMNELNEFMLSLDKNVVVTMGKEGAMFFSEGKVYTIPAVNIKPEDTTGAGESFAGGFLASFIREQDPIKALKYGATLASFAIEDFGVSKIKKIKREDIEKRLKEAYND